MIFFKDRKKKVKEFVDNFMKQYLHLRSVGYNCDDAIVELYSKYHDEGSREWKGMSLMDQILRWHGLTSSGQIKKVSKSNVEEDKIVDGLKGTLVFACNLKTSDVDECTEVAEHYLNEKYNIGNHKKERKARAKRQTNN
jgi:hypothetical protein